jgi:hypothetical protein
MIEQDISLRHTREALRAHFMVDSHEPAGSTMHDSRRAQECELKRELEFCRRENDNLRRQVRCYRDEVDNMRCREYDKCHDRYERHDSYDHRKQRRTSTEVTPSSSGGYAWPQAETPQIVVSPPRSPTLPCDTTSPPQAHSPAAPMEVDPDWPPLLPPGELNQLNATMLRLPMIPRHQALNEHNTTYPMLPRGFHRSRVDNTVRVGAAAKAAQQNEALGVVLPHNTMRPSNRGFPQTVTDWEGLLRSTHRKDNNKALHMAQAFVTQVQNMLAVQQTEPQHLALKEWTYPDWFTPAPRKGKVRTAPKKSERPLATSSGHLVDGPTDLTTTSAAKPQLPMFPELPPPHDDGWQPRHAEDVQFDMPKLRDEPKVWAMWIDQHLDKCPCGIVDMPDGRVSMRGIRGMQLIKRRNPRPEVAEQQQTQYVFLAAQLFVSPSAYWHALRRLCLTIVPGRTWTPYAGSIANLTIDDLVRFFAVQGVTKEQADNVFEYAYQWLTKAIIDRPSQSAEIQSVLGEVNLAISEAGNRPPRGYGVQWWQPFFRWPAQLYAGPMLADECAALVAQYGPFDEPVEDLAILNPNYVRAIDTSRHQSAPSDTISLGHTSPESSVGLPASRLMTRTTDRDSELESGVAPSVLPASSVLPLLAAMDAHAPLAQPPATSSSMSLTFVHHDVPIACIDDILLYDDRYAQTLSYGDDTPMDDN